MNLIRSISITLCATAILSSAAVAQTPESVRVMLDPQSPGYGAPGVHGMAFLAQHGHTVLVMAAIDQRDHSIRQRLDGTLVFGRCPVKRIPRDSPTFREVGNGTHKLFNVKLADYLGKGAVVFNDGGYIYSCGNIPSKY